MGSADYEVRLDETKTVNLNLDGVWAGVSSNLLILLLRAPSRGENLSFLGVIGCVEKSPTG